MTVTPSIDATVEALCGDLSAIRAPRGSTLNAKSWATEAPLRMLLNNLDAEVAERPEDLVVYGGSGRAARSHDALKGIVRALLELGDAETLLVQSGKPVAVFRTTAQSPRVLIANSLLVPRWATWDEFRRLEAEGLTMFGQMTAGSWIYIGTQGILQGTYQTFAAAAQKHFGEPSLAGRTILTAGLGGMGGAQPLAATMAGAAILCVEVDPSRIERRLETRYLDEATESLDDALARVRAAAAEGRALSVGLLGNAADVVPELARRGEPFDLVTDQTAAHDPLTGYIPRGLSVAEADALRASDPDEYLRRAGESIATHVEGMLAFARSGSHVFDYGNNLRGEAQEAGVADAFSYPGFVPAYVRPLFCRGIGPFRWAALSGDPADIATIDDMLRELFPDDALLQRWLELAPGRVAFQGLPARICWLGFGDRAKAGLAINELVASGKVMAPVVIGRDHLDAGSVASPYRETEAMRDGSDAIADWPILNALVNVAAGATWVSVHHGGGVGIGNSIHAGMVVLADGTVEAAGAARARADDRSRNGRRAAPRRGLPRGGGRGAGARHRPARRCPRLAVADLLIRGLAQLATPVQGVLPLRGRALADVDVIDDAYLLCRAGRIESVGRMRDLPALADEVEELDGSGLCAVPGLVDCHTHPAFGGDRVEEFSLRAAGATYEELHAAGGGILSTVSATRALDEDALLDRVRLHARWMLVHGTTTWEGKSGYGLDRATELASLRSIRRAGGSSTWLGAHAVPPEHADADEYLAYALAEVLPAAAQLADAADVFLERGAFDAAQARRYLAGVSRRGARAAAARRPVHRERGGAARGRARCALGRPSGGDRPGGRRGARGERRVRGAAAGERALSRPADAAGPRSRRRGRGDRARDRLQPGQLVHDEPAVRLLARLHAAAPLTGRGALRGDGECRARPRAGLAHGATRTGARGRCRPARRPGLALPGLSPGR